MIGAALRIGFGTASLLAGGWALRALQGTPSALGASPVEIDGIAKGSPNYHDGEFVNIEPASPVSLTRQEQFLLVREVVGGSSSQHPCEPVPVVVPDPSLAVADLAVTWYGHSSAVIEIDGYRVLADPVWSDRCSPSRAVGPRRLHPVPAPLEALPAIDAVIISHDHYDHLDIDTIKQLARTQRATFFVPARHRRAPADLAHPRRSDRRTRLERERPTRRTHPGVHTRPALLRAVPDPQHDAVVVVGADRAESPRLLRR